VWLCLWPAAPVQERRPSRLGGSKPSIADVDRAARLSFSTRATCRELDDTIHDIDEYTCAEHPRHCNAPGDSVAEFGCYVIGCDVHMAVALKGGKTVDFYNCDRLNGDCFSVTGGCPSPTYSCVTGRRHRLALDTSRGTDDQGKSHARWTPRSTLRATDGRIGVAETAITRGVAASPSCTDDLENLDAPKR
jgi:hypothetical protein